MEPFLKKYLQFKPFKADISDVRTLAGLAGINNEMMDEGKVLTPEPEVFEKTKAEFATARFIIQQTILAAVNSGVDVKSHVADAVKFENALKTQQAEVRSGRKLLKKLQGSIHSLTESIHSLRGITTIALTMDRLGFLGYGIFVAKSSICDLHSHEM